MAFQHSIVRDLAWVMASPALWRSQPASPCDGPTALDVCSEQLASLDQDPTPLIEAIQSSPDKRLGHRFESLMAYWMALDPRYAVLAHNLAVRDERQTIGEFDFIVQDHQLNKTLHVEVACKFYLGFGDLQHLAAWHGPMLKDRLDIKLQHMRSRQIRLAEHPASQRLLQQQGIHIDQTACLIKGRLFSPLHLPQRQRPADISANHLHGWWCPVSEFIDLAPKAANIWQPLSKPQWFSSRRLDPTMPTYRTSDLYDHFLASPQHPLCVAGFNNDHMEVERGFLVSDHWGPNPCSLTPTN